MKMVAQNRRARFDYELLEQIEAGIMLTGGEAKSCRLGHVSLAGAYVSFLGGKAVLKNSSITRYPMSGPSIPHEDKRDRFLLLKQSELDRLQRQSEEKGNTIVPLEVRAGKTIKVLIALGKGRKKLDKRQVIKERETGRRLREGREE